MNVSMGMNLIEMLFISDLEIFDFNKFCLLINLEIRNLKISNCLSLVLPLYQEMG